ncbi:MAG TPA: M6 family metalloprotease domain-containing protein [Candidatus Bathyarchaeia archaeon]|nr:M6 family metalloprotease domain-containing protein [Candidatus Bathyarchaeia archaeon]
MRTRAALRGILVALLFLSLLAPNSTFNSILNVQSNRPVVSYESIAIGAPTDPSFSMPLPAPNPSYTPSAAPVSGTIRVLLIAAAFSDINYTLDISTIKQDFFGMLASYYHEVSLGTLTIVGDAYGWYTLPYPEAHYGHNCMAINDADCSGADGSWQVAYDASLIAQKQDNVNFMNYDYFAFIHSGNGQESSGVKDDVWSVTYLGGVYVRTNSRTLTRFNIDPELEAGGAVPNGVWCHEFGHNLGLPDLYNTSNGKTILGPWELMDKGLWNGDPPGSSPAHMTAWDKTQLGFIRGSTLAVANPGVASTYTIDPTEVISSNVHAIEIPLTATLNPSQYYLVEARATIGFDSALPAVGVLITYVDNTALIGRVHVMDGHPSTANLMDAVWNVGQTYTDTTHNIAITVTAQVGNGYQISINGGTAQPQQPNQNQNQTTPYVNLAITNINAQPNVITLPNTTVTITVQISNIGTAGVTNVLVQVTLDGQSFTNMQVNVGAGSSIQTSFTWTSTVGGHTFQVSVDPNHTTNNINYASCVATFNLSVGPTLTINIPLSVASAGNVWVLINGVRYNVTSSQFQASVPNGTITVQIQSTVSTSPGVRQLFNGWTDGNSANPRQVQVTTNTILQAAYGTQYLLSVNPNMGRTTTSGWYAPNSIVTVSATNPSNVTMNTSRLLFTGWTGGMNVNSTSINVNMTQPLSLTANWTPQYYVTIISPTGSPTGSGWYNSGQIATVGVQSTVQYSNGTRQIFTGWDSPTLGQNPSGQVMVNSAITLHAAWKTQYQVTLQSQYGSPSGSGWYDAGTTVPVSIQPLIDYGNATRRVFKGWTGSSQTSSTNMTFRANSPRTLNARWSTLYQVTFKVNGLPNGTSLKLNLNSASYDLSINNIYQTWYEKGTTLNPTLNQTLVSGFYIYKFSGWHNSTGATIQSPMTVNAPQTYVAFYTPQVTLPPVPGFPTEGTLVGILIGILLLGCLRRRRRKH